MPPSLAVRFPVHSFDVDAFQTLSLPALAGYLQEVAGQHADALGCGLRALQARGLTWVLARQRIEAPRTIALGEEVEITTWPSGVDRLFATRELVVRLRDGTEVARSSTAWLVLDLDARRAVRPEQAVPPEILVEQTAPVARPPSRLPAPPADGFERRFQVRYQDIDANRHVTSTSYVAWALECISEERWRGWRPCAVEAHFLAESLLGDVVLGRAAGAGDELCHAIAREADGKELARLRTRWARRD